MKPLKKTEQAILDRIAAGNGVARISVMSECMTVHRLAKRGVVLATFINEENSGVPCGCLEVRESGLLQKGN